MSPILPIPDNNKPSITLPNGLTLILPSVGVLTDETIPIIVSISELVLPVTFEKVVSEFNLTKSPSLKDEYMVEL